MSVNYSTRSGSITGIFSIFFNVKGVLCVFIRIASSSKDYTHYTLSNIKETHSKLSQICSYDIFPRDSKNELEMAVVNKPSVFEPRKFC